MSTPHEPDRPEEGGAHAAPRPAPPIVPEPPESSGAPTEPTAPAKRSTGGPDGDPTRASGPTPAHDSSRDSSRDSRGVIEEDLRTGAPATRPDGEKRPEPEPEQQAPATGPAGRAPESESGRRTSSRTEREEAPPRRGVVRHVLGVVVGLVLTPFAFLLAGIGGARLADIAGTSRMGTDTLGVVVLSAGIALLVAIVVLGVWSAAVPVTGGVFWGLLLGSAYLLAPGDVERAVEDFSGGTVPAAMDQFAQSAMSGLLLLVGVLLLASGVATAIARRSGRRYGTAVVEHEHADRRGETARP